MIVRLAAPKQMQAVSTWESLAPVNHPSIFEARLIHSFQLKIELRILGIKIEYIMHLQYLTTNGVRIDKNDDIKIPTPNTDFAPNFCIRKDVGACVIMYPI